MARLHAQAVVEAVPRPWFEEYVRALLDRAGDLGVDEDGWLTGDDDLGDVALVEGEHLKAGARYQRHRDPPEGVTGKGTTSELLITSWRRSKEVSAEVTTWGSDDERTTWSIKLAEPDALRSVVTGGRHHGRRRVQRLSWAAQIDFRQWWRQADKKLPGGEAPATVLIRHPYGQGRLQVRPVGVDGGKWRVSVTARVRGRGWLRPIAAVGLLFLRGTLQKHFRELVTEMADGWNKDLPELLAHDPRDAEFWLPEFRGDREELRRWLEETERDG